MDGALRALAVLWVLGALFRPIEAPLVMWFGGDVPAMPSRELLPEAEPAELKVGDRVLRGFYVPAEPGAPLVLHLMASGLSVMAPRVAVQHEIFIVNLGSFQRGVRQFADRGFASLAFDYGGVGNSEGSRTLAEFASDVRAMWAEALRRVDGDASRVVLRGTSLGALAAGMLLDEGARPRALLLHAPVRSETVVVHFADEILPGPLPVLVTPWLHNSLDVDLVDTLARSGVPAHLFLNPGDELLPAEEAQALVDAAQAAGGSSHEDDAERGWFFGELPAEPLIRHQLSSKRSAQILEQEDGVIPGLEAHVDRGWRVERVLERAAPELRELFERRAGESQRERLAELCHAKLCAHPDLLLAGVLADVPSEAIEALDDAWPSRLPPFLRGANASAQLQLLDLSDPSGDLPLHSLISLAREVWSVGAADEHRVSRFGLHDARRMWTSLGRHTRGAPRAMLRQFDSLQEIREHGLGWALNGVWRTLEESACREHAGAEPGATQQAALARRAQRLVLKACGVPDRLDDPASNDSGLQAFESGEWHAVDAREPFALDLSPRRIDVFELRVPREDPSAALSEPWWVAHRAP